MQELIMLFTYHYIDYWLHELLCKLIFVQPTRDERNADANASAMLKLTLMEMQMIPRCEKERTAWILKNGGEEGYRVDNCARCAKWANDSLGEQRKRE